MADLSSEYLIDSTLSTKTNVKFVQIGAHDGVSNDPLARLLRQYDNWEGLSVEPVPSIFRKLQNNRGTSKRFLYSNVAIGDRSGRIPFYCAEMDAEKAPEWLTQVGSFERAHVERHIRDFEGCRVASTTVLVRRLDDVLHEHQIREFDLLIIDAEGQDFEILQQVDLTARNVKVVALEAVHLSREHRLATFSRLKHSGFVVFYVAGDIVGIRSAPRWVLRGYKHAIVEDGNVIGD